MQWSASKPNAGFTIGEPWMPVNENYAEINVEAELKIDDDLEGHDPLAPRARRCLRARKIRNPGYREPGPVHVQQKRRDVGAICRPQLHELGAAYSYSRSPGRSEDERSGFDG